MGQTRQPLSTRLKTLKKNAEKWAQNSVDSDELEMLYRNSNKTKLYEAIMNHGADNMQIDELEVHEHSSKDELIKILKERETHFIKTNNSLENGWNNLSKTETAKRNRDRKKRIKGRKNSLNLDSTKSCIAEFYFFFIYIFRSMI